MMHVTIPLTHVMQLARDPLVRLVMESDGVCADDMVQAFAAAMMPLPANDNARSGAMPNGIIALASRRQGSAQWQWSLPPRHTSMP